MKKTDVRIGTVYAYQQYGRHPLDPIQPIVFLSEYPWLNTLRQDARGYGPHAFKRPHSSVTKPQAGTVYNDGTIGYPAVIGSTEASEQELATLRSLRLDDFDAAREDITEDGLKFVLVTSMARVTGEWEPTARPANR